MAFTYRAGSYPCHFQIAPQPKHFPVVCGFNVGRLRCAVLVLFARATTPDGTYLEYYDTLSRYPETKIEL